ncbi:sporulation protein YpjB [Paenibacillus senegalensis]|uniref:sporulation protein YpjB n=1 Tax=Paenibacillus senegalensis TaxID=1465766 RepID=UPI0002899E10|nr:sporulation protein YpjB [Paenibacillus senegalensis]
MLKIKWSRRTLALVLCIGMLLLIMTGCMSKPDMPDEREAQPQTSEETVTKLKKLNRIAEDMHNRAKNGDVSGAHFLLNQFSEELLTLPFAEISTLEGMKAVTDAVDEAKRTLVSANLSPQKALEVSVKIRLLADAMTHPHEPMWVQFYPRMKTEHRTMETAYKKQELESAQSAVKLWEASYLTIRPSLLVSRDPEAVNKLDSLLTFIKNRSAEANVPYEEILNALQALQQGIDEIFYKQQDQTAYLPMHGGGEPYIWSIGVGSIILTVLTFVAWRMFHSDKRFAKVPRDR